MVIFIQYNAGGNTPSCPPDIKVIPVEIKATPSTDNGLYIKDVSNSAAVGPIYAVVNTATCL